MGTILAKAQKKINSEQLKEIAEQISQLERLEKNDTAGRQAIIDLLQVRIDEIKKSLEKSAGRADGEVWDFGKEKKQATFAENDILELKPLTEEYRDLYIETRANYAAEKAFYRNPEYTPYIFSEVKQKESFFAAVVRRADNVYIGYVGLKDTSKDLWEFAVEFLPEYCNQGYGYSALKLFLKKISEITQNMQFRALVEVDNLASQKLMLKLGGKAVGIYDYVFHSEDRAKEFEDEHLNEITEPMMRLAKELNIEARKLLSHVLDYRIYAQKL